MIKIFFKHYHDGNEFREWEQDFDESIESGRCKASKPPDWFKYATRARAVDVEIGTIVAEEWAFCGLGDNPNRKKGRMIAKGRLEKRGFDVQEIAS